MVTFRNIKIKIEISKVYGPYEEQNENFESKRKKKNEPKLKLKVQGPKCSI